MEPYVEHGYFGCDKCDIIAKRCDCLLDGYDEFDLYYWYFFIYIIMNNNLKNKPIIKSRINNLDLKEKSVCLVSYASYMYDKKYGSVIDSNDVVVRINNGLNLLNEIDFGKYTDIIYIFFGGSKQKVLFKSFNELNNTNIELSEILILKKLLCISNMHIEKIKECKIKYANNRILFIDIILPHLTSGISAMIILLYLKPKSLYLTGFSFDNFIYPGYDKFFKQYKKITYNRLNKKFSEWNAPHSELFEKYVVKSLLNNYNNITTDDIMTDVLSKINIDKLHNNIYYERTFIDNFNIIKQFIDQPILDAHLLTNKKL